MNEEPHQDSGPTEPAPQGAKSAENPERAEGATEDARAASDPGSAAPESEEARVRLTPTLIVLGVLAVALGIAIGLIMSAKTLAP